MNLTAMIRELLKRVEQQDQLIAEAVAAEREACASVAEDQTQEYEAYTGRETNLAYQCAAAIRARATVLGEQGGDKP